MTTMPDGHADYTTERFQIRPLPASGSASLESATPSSSALGDWALLLSAVQVRLFDATQGCGHAQEGPVPHICKNDTRGTIVECVQALGQLHHMFSQEVERQDILKMEVFDARTALAQARAELRGTQAGERRARYRALHDGLTALPNRAFFMDALALALHRVPSTGLAVMYLDLDQFKPINDQYGHAVGDEMLRIVAARLARVMRAQDVVSRLGGDEFACLLQGLGDRERLHDLACEMLQTVSAPCRIGPLTLSVRPSIGIACCPSDGDGAQTLLNNADAAMFRAKRAGGGHAFFSG